MLDRREAARRAAVTSRTVRIGEDEQRIPVAVCADVNQVEPMFRRFAFGPKTAFRTRPEGDFAGFECLVHGFTVHKAEHEDLP